MKENCYISFIAHKWTMNAQKLTCVFLLCLLKVLHYARSLDGSIFASTLHLKKYLASEAGFDLNPDQQAKHMIWVGGKIPYYMDTLSYDTNIRNEIRARLYKVNELTGVKFTELVSPPLDPASRWVLFINRINKRECDEHVLTNAGAQRIILGFDCLALGFAVPKAVLAILNIPPQHNSPDRNNFIKINEDHILPDKRQYFTMLSDADWLFHDVEYDFRSVGHYNYFQYTLDGQQTITPVNNSRETLYAGEAINLSESDIWKIVMLYKYIISRSQSNNNYCNKMFEPGSNYSHVALKTEKVWLTPRQLPRQYLGLPLEETLIDSPGSEKFPNEFEGTSDENIADKGENNTETSVNNEEALFLKNNTKPRFRSDSMEHTNYWDSINDD